MTMEALPQDLADFLVTRNFDPEYFDDKGQPAEAGNAKTMKFDYVAGSGKNYGTAVCVIADNELSLFYGDNLGRGMEPEDKQDWFSFLEELSNKAASHSATWSPRDINQLKHTLAGIAAIKEGLFEGYYGNRKISYMGEQTQARLVIKHNRTLGEDDKRYRYVESLFIETADQERFKLPFKSLSGGRAMLEHVRSGGRPYDVRGNHIAEIVSEMAVLSRFNRAQHNRVYEGVTQELVESARQYYQNLQETIKHLGSPRGYQAYFETWAPDQTGQAEALVENLRNMFVEQTLDARIEAALPTLAKIQQQGNNMKEAEIFENWINNLSEGTWALPETPEQQEKLNQLMSAELIVGPDATNATELLYDIVGDDKLFDILSDLADRSEGRANIWDDSDVQERLAQLGIQTPQSTEAEPADVEQDEAPPVKESTGQPLSVQQLASISDEALDKAYGYGRSSPGNTFGWQANLKSAAYAKQMIDQGVTDIEAISDAIHKGWNTTAQAFVQDPEQFDDTAKLAAAGKLEAKLQQRAQLMKQNYAQLPEEEKEKDRVVARALLQAIRGEQQQGVTEISEQENIQFDNWLKTASPQDLWDEASKYESSTPYIGREYEKLVARQKELLGPAAFREKEINDRLKAKLKPHVTGDGKNVQRKPGYPKITVPMREGDNTATFVESDDLAHILKHAGVPIKENVLTDSTGSTLDHIMDTYKRDVKDFEQTGNMSDALHDVLYDYYFDDMPYAVKKGRDEHQDPYEWVSDRFADDLGMNENLIATQIMPVSEGSCNMTAEGEYCPEHGLAECGMSSGGAVGMPYSMGEAQKPHPKELEMDALVRSMQIQQRADDAERRLAQRADEPHTLGQKVKKDIGGPFSKLFKGDVKGALSEIDDPINSNSAMTGSYYEGKESKSQEGDALLARIKSLALLR